MFNPLEMVVGFKGAAAAFGIGLLLGAGPAYFKGRADVKANWDAAIEEAENSKDVIDDKVDEVNDARDDEVDAGKEEHRDTDMVKRIDYNKLETALDDEKDRFDDLLRKFGSLPSTGGKCNCFNEPMPDELQRRATDRGSDPNQD